MIFCVRVFDIAEGDARWEEILDALDAISPLIEDTGGIAYCEMHGIAGNAERWLEHARELLEPFSVRYALGVGPNRFVAKVAAICGRTCAPGDEAAFVAPMPLDVLEIDPKICDRLQILGIRTLGELAALPHGPFVRRFGMESARWHARARGIDEKPLVPRPRRLRIERALFGEGSAASEEALLFALRTLVSRIVDDLIALGKRAAELMLALECENGDVRDIHIHIAQPTAREGMLFDLIRARLEGVQLEAPADGLRLRIERMEGAGTPLSLLSGDDPDAEALELALARLEAAFGENSVLRARVVDGYRPERCVVYERFSGLPLPQLQKRGESRAARNAALQLRMRPEPQPIDIVVRDGVPRFAGTPSQAILDFAGPWRIAEDWWSENSLTRDDYDVMLDDETLYRIARREAGWFLLGSYD
jgi:protein ImuB